MPGREPFQYAVIRVVPRVERGELINAGVVVFCRARGFLRARVALDERALAALAPGCGSSDVREQLEAVAAVAAGEAGGGPIAALPPSERFHWLVSPSSTVVQPGPVHTGLTEDPERELEHLFEKLVER